MSQLKKELTPQKIIDKIDCVYLDMDGVIANFSEGALGLWGLRPDLEERIRGWDDIPRVLTEELGFEVSPKMLWRAVDDAGPDFFRKLRPYPWALDLYAACDELVPVVLMTTAISPQAAMGKMQWMNKWFPDAKRHAITPCKHHFARRNALLIDDAEHNVESFKKHGGQAYLWPMPWNHEMVGALSMDVAADSIAEIRSILEEHATQR